MVSASAVVHWGRVLTVVLTTVMVLSKTFIDVLLIQNLVVEIRIDGSGMLVLAVHVAIHVSVMIFVIVSLRAIGVGHVTVDGIVDGLVSIAVSVGVFRVGVTVSAVVEILVPVRMVLVLHTLTHMASLSVVRTTSLIGVPVVMHWVARSIVSRLMARSVSGLVHIVAGLMLVSATIVLSSEVV